jgi:hypothetical protein
MAEAKTKKAKPKARASNKPKAGASSKAKSARPAASSRKRSTGKPKTSTSKPAPSKPQAVLDAVEETAKDAGGIVGRAASKAKVPLLAGGAALAGAAGGLALGSRQAHHKSGLANGLGKVSSKDLAKAARKAGDVGAQVGEIALEVRRARESTNGHGKDHRSPIEVVLQGLTSRR